MNAKLFINYRREDTRHAAGRLYDHLITHFGKEQVFMDVDQIEFGDDFVEVIDRKVGACDIAIVMIGRHWLGAEDASGKRRLDNEEDFVRMEIVAALQRKIRVIPVLVDGAQMPRRDDLPEALVSLSRRNAIELSDTRFQFDVNRLIEAIKRCLAVVEKKAELRATSAAPVAEPASVRLTDQETAATQFNLGLLHAKGEGVPKDLRKAVELFQKAADQGDAAAHWNLGLAYQYGRGVPRDLAKHKNFFKRRLTRETLRPVIMWAISTNMDTACRRIWAKQ